METEIGMLSAILVAMNDTSDEDIQNFINGDEVNGDTAVHESNDEEEKDKSKNIHAVPLSSYRLHYLEHLIDDVYCFLTHEQRKRDYEVMC